MKRWYYKISVRDINKKSRFRPINFEYSIKDIENLTPDEIKDILIEVSLKRILEETGIAYIVFSFEFGEVEEEYLYTDVYIWVK